MLYYLAWALRDVIGPLNVVRYITFRTAAASLSALALSLIFGPPMIRKLRDFRIAEYALHGWDLARALGVEAGSYGEDRSEHDDRGGRRARPCVGGQGHDERTDGDETGQEGDQDRRGCAVQPGVAARAAGSQPDGRDRGAGEELTADQGQGHRSPCTREHRVGGRRKREAHRKRGRGGVPLAHAGGDSGRNWR